MPTYFSLRILCKVTKWRAGCVLETQPMDLYYVPIGLSHAEEATMAKGLGGDMFSSLPTHHPLAMALPRPFEGTAPVPWVGSNIKPAPPAK